MTDYLQGCLIGLLIGAITTLTLVMFLTVRPLMILEHSRKQLIEECQGKLPRTQECVLVAVPKDEVK